MKEKYCNNCESLLSQNAQAQAEIDQLKHNALGFDSEDDLLAEISKLRRENDTLRHFLDGGARNLIEAQNNELRKEIEKLKGVCEYKDKEYQRHLDNWEKEVNKLDEKLIDLKCHADALASAVNWVEVNFTSAGGVLRNVGSYSEAQIRMMTTPTLVSYRKFEDQK